MITFQALGGVAVAADGAEIGVGGPRQRRLLAVLLIHRNSVVSADRLVDAVFDGEPTAAAQTTLRSYIARVRRVVDSNGGPVHVVTQPPGYMLRVADDEFDVARFERAISEARSLGVTDPRGAAALLRRALMLWRGEPYAEFADEDWARPEAQRLAELRLTAHELLFDFELEDGAGTTLIADIERLAREHLLRESFTSQLMVALYRSGRQADALRVYQEHRTALVESLGLEPTPALRALEQQILSHDPALSQSQAGLHELRGYRLGVRLGTGSGGTVFSARIPGVERELAIRVLRAEIADDPAFVRDFESKAHRVASLRHPAIVPIHDYWREPGAAYVVTRRLHGGTLNDRAASRRLTTGEAVALVRRIGGALVTAARAGVVHGRVTAGNVLYDEANEPCLSDFDLGDVMPAPQPADDVRDFARLVRSFVDHPAVADLAEAALAHDAGASIAALVEATAEALDAELSLPVPLVNPYKGLRAFEESDSDDFFGRQRVSDEIIARLRSAGPGGRLVLLVGGSGSGKSSVARAGVLPRVRRGEIEGSASWLVATMMPGPSPLDALVDALARVAVRGRLPHADELCTQPAGLHRALSEVLPPGGELLLLVDQLEELFTLSPERERMALLDGVLHAVNAPDSQLRVLATLRADFYDRPLDVRGFGGVVQDATVTIPAMSAAELEAAIVEPAERVGRSVERALVAELVAAVASERAALPALQFALWEVADRCGATLTAAVYRDLGGISGAISARAEQLFTSLDSREQDDVRRIFEQLIVVRADGEPTRRVATRPELTGDGADPELDALLERWVGARLLTLDRHAQSRVPTVEVAHEALLRQWPRLRRWIEQDWQRLVVGGELRDAALAWVAMDRDDGVLYRGARLQVALDTIAGRGHELPTVEREFLDASVRARDAETAEAAANAQRQARANRRLRIQLGVIAVALVVALVGGYIAIDQRGAAEGERRVATARELSAASVANIDEDPERSILLALAAVDVTRSHGEQVLPEAAEALHYAVSSSRLLLDVPDIGGALDWSPTGLFVTEGPEQTGIVDIRDGATGRSRRAFQGHAVDVNDVAFNLDGSMLATTGDDGALRVWDPTIGSLLDEFVVPDAPTWAPSFSPDGRYVAAVWNLEDGSLLRVIDLTDRSVVLEYDESNVSDTAFSPDGRLLALGDNGGDHMPVIDATTGAVVYYVGDGQQFVEAVAFSPDGRWLATAGGDATVRLWSAEDGAPGLTIPAGGPVESLDWTSDGTLLGLGSNDGSAKVIDVSGGAAVERLSLGAKSLNNGVAGVAFSPDGDRLMTSDFSIESVKVWDIRPAGGGEIVNVPAAPFHAHTVAFTGDGALAAGTVDGRVSTWDVSTGAPGPVLASHIEGEDVSHFAIDPAGELLATSGRELPVRISNIATGELVGTVSNADGGFVMDLAWDPSGEHLLVAFGAREFGETVIADRTGHEVARLAEEPDVFMHEARFDVTGDTIVSARWPVMNDPAKDGVRVWDWRTGAVLRTMPQSSWYLAVDPTGRFVASTRRLNAAADIWDATTGELAATLGGPSLFSDIVFDGAGTRVATAGEDGTVRVWNPANGTQELVLRHAGTVSAVAFSPDGNRLASLGGDGIVRVWTLDVDELVDIARARLTRDLTDDECRQYLHVAACDPA